LRQILLNLLTNAIKFTPRNGDVRVVTGYLDDGRVFLVVRDTGCGMKGKMPTAAREDFPNNEPWANGTGIGLPLVERLVREMGAEMEIDSAPQKGTVVLIAFGGFARWSA
jgi:signal transduction histidine kinase